MVWQWRASPVDQLFHFLGYLDGPEPKGYGPHSLKLKVSNIEGDFICETMFFPVPICD